MTLPLSTTTVTVRRPASGGDPYEDAAMTTVVAGLPAHIGSPSGRERIVAGSKETLDASLDTDPADIRHVDRIFDDVTGDQWEVVWAQARRGFGLDHVEGGLRRVTGASSG